MVKISDIGREMLEFQARLAEENHYEPLNQLSIFGEDVRDKYLKALPGWCVVNGEPSRALYTLTGAKIATGYRRIVIGDYGAFVEVVAEQIVRDALCVKKGQEYRYKDERFAEHVKYLWLTAKDASDCKIYLQKKTVDYADYVPGMYYISPYECCVECLEGETEHG